MSACPLVQLNELRLYRKPEKDVTTYVIEKLENRIKYHVTKTLVVDNS